jgi:hypothetical protein
LKKEDLIRTNGKAAMTGNNIVNNRLTWNKVSGLTLIAVLIGVLFGIWMMGQRIFLAPPMAAATSYFYVTVGFLPGLITFLICIWTRPRGKRFMLVVLIFLSCLIFFFYLIIIGPGFYNDIQCRAFAGPNSSGHLECGCRFETSEGNEILECSAEKLSPLPLIRLIEENRGGP